MSRTRPSFSARRSSRSLLMPFARSRSMSAALAARILPMPASSASAIASRAAFFSSVLSWATSAAAARAAFAVSISVFILRTSIYRLYSQSKLLAQLSWSITSAGRPGNCPSAAAEESPAISRSSAEL